MVHVDAAVDDRNHDLVFARQLPGVRYPERSGRPLLAKAGIGPVSGCGRAQRVQVVIRMRILHVRPAAQLTRAGSRVGSPFPDHPGGRTPAGPVARERGSVPVADAHFAGNRSAGWYPSTASSKLARWSPALKATWSGSLSYSERSAVNSTEAEEPPVTTPLVEDAMIRSDASSSQLSRLSLGPVLCTTKVSDCLPGCRVRSPESTSSFAEGMEHAASTSRHRKATRRRGLAFTSPV